MRVRFLQDYQGKLTGPHFYRVGEVYELDQATAETLVAEGRAEVVGPASVEDGKPARKGRK